MDTAGPTTPFSRSVAIDAPAEKVIAFLADARNWPRWAIVNVLAVGEERDGWWPIETPDGPARIRLHVDAAHGVIDHDFGDEHSVLATVPARVTPNGRGATFTMTLLRPDEVSESDFAEFLTTVDAELAALRAVMESDSA